MAEMRTIGCPSCEKGNQPRSILDGVEEYRCSSCGMVYYGPCGCDTVHEDRDDAQAALEASDVPESALPPDWEMSGSAARIENGSSAQTRPGGC